MHTVNHPGAQNFTTNVFEGIPSALAFNTAITSKGSHVERLGLIDDQHRIMLIHRPMQGQVMLIIVGFAEVAASVPRTQEFAVGMEGLNRAFPTATTSSSYSLGQRGLFLAGLGSSPLRKHRAPAGFTLKCCVSSSLAR